MSEQALEQSTDSLEEETSPETLEAEASLEEQPLTQAEKRRINSLKLKYNGKEIEEKLPFEIDDDPAAIAYMTQQLQLAKLSQTRAAEAKALENEVISFMQELKANPRKALANPMIGIDVKQLAAEILEEEIENSKKSPEQIKIEQYEAKLREIEEERQREKTETERRAYEQTLERSYEKYENMLLGALDSNPDLPSTPYIVDKMTKYMSIAVEEGYEPDMDIISNIVRDEVNGDIKHLLNILPVDKVESLIGKEVLDKLRKSRLATAKKAPTSIKSIAKDVAARKPEVKQDVKKQTIKDFFGV